MKVKEITPNKFACMAGGCPAVFETNRDTYLIIGTQADTSDKRLIGRIGPNEVVIEVPVELLRGITIK